MIFDGWSLCSSLTRLRCSRTPGVPSVDVIPKNIPSWYDWIISWGISIFIFLFPQSRRRFYKHQMWAEGDRARPLAALCGLSSECNPKWSSVSVGACVSLLSWQETLQLRRHIYITRGPGSSVGIATGYGLDGPGFESRRGWDFPPVQIGPGAHPASYTVGTGSFPGVKSSRGVTLTPHPLLVPLVMKE